MTKKNHNQDLILSLLPDTADNLIIKSKLSKAGVYRILEILISTNLAHKTSSVDKNCRHSIYKPGAGFEKISKSKIKNVVKTGIYPIAINKVNIKTYPLMIMFGL